MMVSRIVSFFMTEVPSTPENPSVWPPSSRIAVPKLKPYFFGILTDPEGRIYVQRNMNTGVKRGYGPIATENKQFDVFSREGTFLFRAALPPNTRDIRGELVYSYFVDEDQGLEYAQRFRIKNYADLPVR